MILVIDIGNSNIVIGAFENDKLTFTSRIATTTNKTSDEYAVIIAGIFNFNNVSVENIEGMIMSSVVPQLIGVFEQTMKKFTQEKLKVVGPGIKTGFKIKIDNPAQMGTDMVCDVEGAVTEFKGVPIIVVDMGTATTLTLVDENGDILGGAIAPGVIISLNALSSQTAQLPFINIESAKSVIGKNTVESMLSGVILGSASMIDGMIDRMSQEIEQNPVIVATGGISSKIVPYCKHKIEHRPNLLVDGLYSLYQKNK